MTLPPDGTDPSSVPRDIEQEKMRERLLGQFRERLNEAIKPAERMGALVSVMIAKPQDVLSGKPSLLYEHLAKGPDGPLRMHPASTIKVAQAIYLASKLDDLTEEDLTDGKGVSWSHFVPDDGEQKGDFVTGGGEYDKSEYRDNPELRHASYRDLFEDMLGANSGNMAAKILMGPGSVEDFNAFWRERAPTVRLTPDGDRGWFTVDDVLPADMLMVAASLTQLGGTPVGQMIREALTGGSGKSGTVSCALGNELRDKLLSKTGELPPYPDDNEPNHRRHDIGVFEGYAYVIMTESPSRIVMADSQEVIEKVGAYMAHEQGHATVEWARRNLGRRALKRVVGLANRFRD